MHDAFTFAAVILLVTVAAALVRCWKGPARVDRIMAAQLVGTGVIGIAVALGTARRDPAMLDAALTGTLLAAVLVSAFVRGSPSAGARPERPDRAQGTEESS
ncbi:monovalent cation/H+ antiporter complex subunit F [Microvirga guangxiensis]|uniref:Multicomponent Na+:H+ antiporter subunit F n=1 Tax=Microvirga guangxiensis TaxID=549386 RepID=A0A1G5KC95_9HYPH|nr:monovalent cation/H+ antiporter complex subunit F [Microvirga guangxiensis]SCY98167.1 multicomponent Na+:H+ antiporter subunit F [Microvirga guangxiensis]